MKKRLISLLLAIVLVFAMAIPSLAAASVTKSKVTNIHNGDSFYVTSSWYAKCSGKDTVLSLDSAAAHWSSHRFYKATITVENTKTHTKQYIYFDSSKPIKTNIILDFTSNSTKYKITVKVTYASAEWLGYGKDQVTFTATAKNGAKFSSK